MGGERERKQPIGPTNMIRACLSRQAPTALALYDCEGAQKGYWELSAIGTKQSLGSTAKLPMIPPRSGFGQNVARQLLSPNFRRQRQII